MFRRLNPMAVLAVVLLLATGFVLGMATTGHQDASVAELAELARVYRDFRFSIYRDDARQVWVYTYHAGFGRAMELLPYSQSVDPRGGE